MRQDIQFILRLSLLIVFVMATLGLVIDGARIIIYGAGSSWKDIFTFTMSMAVLGIVIVIGNIIKFALSRR